MVEDLWPDFGDELPLTPKEILERQASQLSDKTSHRIEGEVQTSKTYGDSIQHKFYLVAPALDHYKYELFKVDHKFPIYPLTIEGFELPDREKSYRGIEAGDEETFKEILKEIFNHEDTKKVVMSLMAYGKPSGSSDT